MSLLIVTGWQQTPPKSPLPFLVSYGYVDSRLAMGEVMVCWPQPQSRPEQGWLEGVMNGYSGWGGGREVQCFSRSDWELSGGGRCIEIQCSKSQLLARKD